MPWPLNRSEAEGDLVLLQNVLFSCINVDVHGSVGMRITRFADMKAGKFEHNLISSCLVSRVLSTQLQDGVLMFLGHCESEK